MNKRLIALLLPLLIASAVAPAGAQCSNWGITAQLASGSACAGNGSFSVSLTGPDAGNISNLQYGIPLTSTGYSVPLNSAAAFNNIPGGYYTVSAIGTCGGNYVGKNTSIAVPGVYVPPVMQVQSSATINCGTYGSVYASVVSGVPPYTFNLLNPPAGYSDPTTITGINNSCSFIHLPAGGFNIQVADACGSAPGFLTAGVAGLNASDAYFTIDPSQVQVIDCQHLVFPPPAAGNAWAQFNSSPLLSYSLSIDGNAFAATPFRQLSAGGDTVMLASGKTIKDCYNKTVTCTIHMPCGNNAVSSISLSQPYLYIDNYQKCSGAVSGHLHFAGIGCCYPITYSVVNSTTGTTYGPYTATTANDSTPYFNPGSYSVAYTTHDGFTGNGNFATSALANPYSVTVLNGAPGLNNYIDGFQFSTTSYTAGIRSIELFNGPAGYSYNGEWDGSNTITGVQLNQSPGPGTLFFKAGTYVWKITDDCGTYYVPVTVSPSSLFQFTAGIANTSLSCQGLTLTPAVTAANNGTPVAADYIVLLNGESYYPNNNSTPQPAGSSVLLQQPGDYIIVPTATNHVDYYSYPFPANAQNVYNLFFTFHYARQSLQVDLNHTQGFVCAGAATGTAQLYTVGSNGIPFADGHYKYHLTTEGYENGPYINSNNTGIFSGFSGSAGETYVVRVEDSCGAYATQKVTILDLGHTHVISSNEYVACAGDSIKLHALYLPGATYSWTGPGGFTSQQQDPVIPNLNNNNIGSYHVAILSPQCATTLTDSTLVTLNGLPPKPIVTVDCDSPASVKLQSEAAGYHYFWQIEDLEYNYLQSHPVNATLKQRIDLYLYGASPYNFSAYALDTTTGCRAYSDTITLTDLPVANAQAIVYSPHLKLCPGDSTTLVAQGIPNPTGFQWYRNGVPIAGATTATYITAQPGLYKVAINAAACGNDTSAQVAVTIVSLPGANITTTVHQLCPGDTALIYADTGTGYSYTWLNNGVTVPGQLSAVLHATATGDYSVVISNGGCIATSGSEHIEVLPSPVIDLQPSANQTICPGASVAFSTPQNSGYTYAWQRNDTLIPGATGNTYTATTAGSYKVLVGDAQCPHVPSLSVAVLVLSGAFSLGNDTTLCQGGAISLPLQVSGIYDTVTWSTGAQGSFATATGPGTYWARAVNACGAFSDTIHIHTAAEYLPSLPNDTTICNAGGNATFTVPAILQNIHWSTGSTAAAITVTAPGTYNVMAESPCGMVSDSVHVTFCPPHIVSISPATDSICEGSCIAPAAATEGFPTSYQWYFPGASPASSTVAVPVQVCYMQQGTYPVKLIVSNVGGVDSMETFITVLSRPVPRFKDTTTTVPYKTILALPACAAAQTADWYLNDSLICHDCQTMELDARLYQGNYHCVVRNGDCTDSCNYHIQVIDIPHDVWLPDAFTPNGDGRNEIFHVITDNPNVTGVQLYIYDRWGAAIYLSRNLKDGWDGTLNGHPMDIGTYFWTLRYTVAGSGETYFKKGDVTLIR